MLMKRECATIKVVLEVPQFISARQFAALSGWIDMPRDAAKQIGAMATRRSNELGVRIEYHETNSGYKIGLYRWDIVEECWNHFLGYRKVAPDTASHLLREIAEKSAKKEQQ